MAPPFRFAGPPTPFLNGLTVGSANRATRNPKARQRAKNGPANANPTHPKETDMTDHLGKPDRKPNTYGKVRNPISDKAVQLDPISDGGRGTDGRFTKGAKPGPGNPYNAQVQTLRRAMLGAVTSQDIAEIIQSLVTSAKSGDTAAIKLLFSYCVGQPHQPVAPDRTEVENLELQEKRMAVETQIRFRESLSTW